MSVYISAHNDVSAPKQQGWRRGVGLKSGRDVGLKSGRDVGLKSGSAGTAFLKLLETLEHQGVIEREFAHDLPENLGGVCGWTVKDSMMEEWLRRRQVISY